MIPPGAATRVLALLGDPVAHSLSPRFQNAALDALGLDAAYVALRCGAGDLPGLLRGLARAGGGGNVTVPHKEEAWRVVERRTDVADATGACNTFWLEDGRVWGDNTDVEGVAGAMEGLLGGPPAGARVLVVGAGGSARAVLHALAAGGAERVVLLNRTASRARALAARFRGRVPIDVVSSPVPLTGVEFDLAVNATPLGLRPGDRMPLRTEGGPVCGAALDLVYGDAGGTPWVRVLRDAGIPAADGREMLLRQGAASFRRWWGRDAPLEVMRAALEEDVEERRTEAP